MTDKLVNLQAAERALRQRYAMNGSQNDQAELNAGPCLHLPSEMPFNEASRRFRPGFFHCDCICNCGSIVQVAFGPPRKGTDDVLCMTCLELSRRKDPAHRPWPESGVVILPPEK